MADLTGTTPADTYKGLLQVNDYTDGVDATAKYIQDGEGTNSALAISTDKVGIGTTSPSKTLDIHGDIQTRGIMSNVSSDEEAFEAMRNENNTMTMTNNGHRTSHSIGSSLGSSNVSADNSGLYIGAYGAGSNTTNAYVKSAIHLDNHFTSPKGVRIFTGSGSNQIEERMRIDRDGNVGIGTTSPDLQLDVNGGIQMRGDQFWFKGGAFRFMDRATGSSVERMRIDSNGNVGIGTTSPDAKLEIVDGSSSVRINQNGESAITFESGSFADFHISHDGTSNKLHFSQGASVGSGKLLTINANNGNVGIGTTSPTAELDVNGSVHLGNLTSSTLSHIIRSGGGVTGNVGNGLKFIPGSAPTTDQYISFYTGASTPVHIGSIGSAADEIVIKTRGSGTALVVNQDGNITPGTDDAQDIGSATKKWDDIYATNGTIQTSDRELKQDIEELSEAETRVAQACKGLLRKYRWKSSVAEKGDDARIHFGIMAQDLEAAFAAEGLDAGRYGMFIKNTWWEADRVIPAVEAVEAVEAVYDEEGNEVSPAVEAVEAQPERTELDIFNNIEDAPEGATEVTQRGVRYAELLAFIIAAI